MFEVGFDHPEWFNGFEHDPEEAARVRVGLLRELAATGEALVATHQSFASVCHVAVAGDRRSLGTGHLGVLTAYWVRRNQAPHPTARTGSIQEGMRRAHSPHGAQGNEPHQPAT